MQSASWAYMDNGGTGVAMIEWTVTNPSSRMAGARSLLKLLEFMVLELHRLDYDMILAATTNRGLVKMMNRVGFETTDVDMTHMVKIKRD